MGSESNSSGTGTHVAPVAALARLADRLPDLIYRYELRPTRRFSFVSAAAERMTGYTPAEHYADPDLGLRIVHPDDREALERMIRDESDFEKPVLLRWIRKDGRVLWTEQFNVPIRDEQGRLVAIEGVARDVTHAHEARLTVEAICHALRDLVLVLDRDGNYRYILPSRADLSYRPASELLGQRLDDVFPPDEAQRFLTAIRTTLETGDPTRLEYSLEIQQRTIWFEASIVPFGADATLWVIRDVTERVEREAEIRRAQKFASAVLDALASSICVVDPNLRIVAVNRSWRSLAALRGLNPEAVGPGHSYVDVCRYAGGPESDQVEAMAAGIREVVQGLRSEFCLEYPWAAAGESRWISARVTPCPEAGEGFVLISHVDISPQHRAEMALRDSETRYRNLFMFSPDPIVVDVNGEVALANTAALRLLGCQQDEDVIGKSLAAFLTPQSQAAFADAMREAREGIVVPSVELLMDTADRVSLIVDARMAPFPLGHAQAVHIILRDVTGARALERERRRLATAIEQAAEAIVITDPNAHILYVNPAFERITGYSRDEVLGQTPRVLRSGRHSEEFYRDLWSTISAGHVWRGRFVNRRRGGTLYTEDATISPVIDDAGRIVHYVAVKRDVTAELEMEAQLEQARRLELVGQIAGGIAHDFNNVLGVVLGESDLALQQFGEDHPLVRPLKTIRAAAEHGAALTRQLLGFARAQPRAPIAFSLNAAIERCLPLLHGLAGDRIRIEWHPSPDLWTVQFDPNQLDEVLLNLMSNARDAISHHGQVTIETANVTVGGARGERPRDMQPGDYVRLSFADTGCGMTPEVLAHAFEPFFTTKEPGRGTGLGLSTVHGIIRQSGGHIALRSEPGRGTRVDIWLPRIARETPTVVSAPPSAPETAVAGTTRARILLCEDQPSLLSLIQRMLQRKGHDVIAVSDPREAIRLAERSGDSIDLLITDLSMPHLDGHELVGRVNAIHPGIKCLLISGCVDDLLAQKTDAATYRTLRKPFTSEELSRAVQEMLALSAENSASA